jgi:teichuronic acid biosynthesis glycosyltransferase TuaH
MAVTSPRRTSTSPSPASGPSLALAVADVNWFTTENLFAELDRPGTAALLLKCIDYGNAWRRGERPWNWGRPLAEASPGLWTRDLVLPSGWMKQFPSWGMRPIARSIDRWRSEHAPGSNLALVMTYPHYLYLRDLVRPEKSIYFNVDDYALYWPRHADRVNALERQAVRESDLTVCVSRLRADQLREAEPGAASKIRHLPHGAPSSSIDSEPNRTPAEPPEDLASLPGPRLGFVGSLEDRIDWRLLAALADAMPHASIVLIGKPGETPAGAWQEDRARCLNRPNVHLMGWRPQALIGRYNAAFDACLIPYLADHPFNVACCPTKIMDCMGTGRPIVSTDLPECLLYQNLFDVVSGPEAFIEAVQSLEKSGFDDGKADARHAWAVDNSCARMVERFLDWLTN